MLYRSLRKNWSAPYKGDELTDEQIEKELEKDGIKDRLVAIGDHITNSWPTKGDDTYLTRRWDLLNLVGSTSVAILLGFFVGLAVRFSIVEPAMLNYHKARLQDLQEPLQAFTIVDVILIVTTIVLLWVLLGGVYRDVRREHVSLLHLIIWSFTRNIHHRIEKHKETVELYREYVSSEEVKNRH